MQKRVTLPVAIIFLVLLIFPLSPEESVQDTRIRVDILLTPVDTGTLQTLQYALAETTAINLRLMKKFDVRVAEAAGGVEEYRTSLEPGAVDRLLAVHVGRDDGSYRINTQILNPLDGIQEMSRSVRIESLLSVFDAVDRIVPELLGELSGRRIAFGSLSVEVTGWDSSPFESLTIGSVGLGIDQERVAEYPSPTQRENKKTEVYIDDILVAESVGTVERVLIGPHRIKVYDLRDSERVLAFDKDVTIPEGRTASIHIQIPIISKKEESRIRELIKRKKYKDLGSFIRACSKNTPVVEETLPFIELGILSKEIERLEGQLEEEWETKPFGIGQSLHSINKKYTNIRQRYTIESARGTLRMSRFEGRRRQLSESYLELLALATLYDTRRGSEWGELEKNYRKIVLNARLIDHVPMWIREDARVLEGYFDAYRSERTERPGLYRSLTWGGLALAAAGGGSWYFGFTKAEEASDLYEDYQSARTLEEADSLHSEVESTQAISNVLQVSGYVAAGIGVSSALTRFLLQNRDTKKPYRRLKSRIEGYFKNRLELADRLYENSQRSSGETNKLASPVLFEEFNKGPEFEELNP